MSLQKLLDKYSLPNHVKVQLQKSDKGITVIFPEYEGCVTFVEEPLELFSKVTDALLTYFEVPRYIAESKSIIYIPALLNPCFFS